MGGRREHIWRCDCGAGHFLSVERYDKMAAAGGYIQIDDPGLKMWRHRLAKAWEILRNGHAETHVGVLLDPAVALEIAHELRTIAARSATWAPDAPEQAADRRAIAEALLDEQLAIITRDDDL